MTLRHVPILAAAAVLAACSHQPGDLASTGGPPSTQTATHAGGASQTPIGPVPGAPQQPPRAENPYAGNVAAMAEGRTLFVRMNCSGCHGGRAGGGMGPSLRDVDWRYGNTAAQVFSSIALGRGQGMPAWGTMINEDQIWKLVTYIQSLRTETEPNAPHTAKYVE
jgi:cytochrome c oxidase cbb3-type subunit 3